MPIVNKANGLLAEFAIFPVEPEHQANLVASVIQNIESTIEHKAGFVSASVLSSRDGFQPSLLAYFPRNARSGE
jgi:hypothetical protein